MNLSQFLNVTHLLLQQQFHLPSILCQILIFNITIFHFTNNSQFQFLQLDRLAAEIVKGKCQIKSTQIDKSHRRVHSSRLCDSQSAFKLKKEKCPNTKGKNENSTAGNQRTGKKIDKHNSFFLFLLMNFINYRISFIASNFA